MYVFKIVTPKGDIHYFCNSKTECELVVYYHDLKTKKTELSDKIVKEISNKFNLPEKQVDLLLLKFLNWYLEKKKELKLKPDKKNLLSFL